MSCAIGTTVAAPYDATTVVEAFDPDGMTGLAGDAFRAVAADARERLVAALDALGRDR